LLLQIVAVLNNHHDSLAWLDEKSRYFTPRAATTRCCGAADVLVSSPFTDKEAGLIYFLVRAVNTAVVLPPCHSRQMHKEIALVKREMSYRNAI
jgi:hypothetical protein